MAAKRPKAEVHYRRGGKHCHACKFYSEDEGSEMTGWCEKVAGPIMAHDVCDLFQWAAMPSDTLRKRGLISDTARTKGGE